jgi:hypothetical protein
MHIHTYCAVKFNLHSDITQTTTRGNIITEMASDFTYLNQIYREIVRNCSRVDVCVVQQYKLNLRAQYIHASCICSYARIYWCSPYYTCTPYQRHKDTRTHSYTHVVLLLTIVEDFYPLHQRQKGSIFVMYLSAINFNLDCQVIHRLLNIIFVSFLLAILRSNKFRGAPIVCNKHSSRIFIKLLRSWLHLTFGTDSHNSGSAL